MLKITWQICKTKSPAKTFSPLSLLWQSLSETLPLRPNLKTICFDNLFIELYKNMISTNYDMRYTSILSYLTKPFPSFSPNTTILPPLITLKLPDNSQSLSPRHRHK